MKRPCVIACLILHSTFAAQGGLPDVPRQKLKGDTADAFGYFAGLSPRSMANHFKAIRPAKLSLEEVRSITAALPWEGEVQPDSEGLGKLATLLPILSAFERQSMVEVKVARLPYACMAFYQRSVLIIAEDTLRILRREELQALAAHELAHEYFWEEYYQAKGQQDSRRLRKIELLCDGIAIIMLSHLGLDPASLVSGVTRINQFNTKMGPPRNELEYPSPRQRAQFHRAMMELIIK